MLDGPWSLVEVQRDESDGSPSFRRVCPAQGLPVCCRAVAEEAVGGYYLGFGTSLQG